MRRPFELVDGGEFGQPVAAAHQNPGIARQGSGIARHGDDGFHFRLRQLFCLRLGAGTRRVEDHGIDIFHLVGHQRFAEQIARGTDDGLEAGRRFRRRIECQNGGAVIVIGLDFAPLGQPEGERTDAAEQIRCRLELAHALHHQPRQRGFAFGCGLQKTSRRQGNIGTAHSQARCCRRGDEFAVDAEPRQGQIGDQPRQPGVFLRKHLAFRLDAGIDAGGRRGQGHVAIAKPRTQSPGDVEGPR